MSKVLDVSRSGYYAWRNRKPSIREIANEKLLKEIKVIFKAKRSVYGSPRLTIELKKQGNNCSQGRVSRLMQKNEIVAKAAKKFKATTNSKHNNPVAPNLLNQNFKAKEKNLVWAGDITYIWTKEGWLYLAAILDVCTRKIVGWSMNKRMNKELVINALRSALIQNKVNAGIIFHSDRGSQYASNDYVKELKINGFRQSMSKKGDCYDNAIMETFFHTLKTELIFWRNYKTRAIAKSDIFEYIEVFYNRERMHSALNYCSPIEFEKLLIVA